MLSERMLTSIIKGMTKKHLALDAVDGGMLPAANPGMHYMLYMHVPFCQVLCPYCSFNRYPFKESVARPYFESMRKEMLMLKDLGYDFESVYVGGGTPTIMIDELCNTLDLARETFSIKEVSCETNPNHLTRPYVEQLQGRVQRLSVGVQSFDNTLLQQMDRYKKYGSGEEILERVAEANPYFEALNVDMIFNFPSQSEEILRSDLEKIVSCGCRQVTFSPLYVSNATTRKMASALGQVDYERERRYYELIDEYLAGGSQAPFERTTLWTFNRKNAGQSCAMTHGKDFVAPACAGTPARAGLKDQGLMVDEYAISYEEYPAIGSGSITHLGDCLYVNNFSIEAYERCIAEGRMPLMGKTRLPQRDLMRYRFLLKLYSLRLDKDAFKRDFGVSVERGLPVEMAFMRANGAFETDDEHELTLTAKGRYLTLVMYRQFLSGLNNLRDQAREALQGSERELLFGEGEPAA